MPTYRFVPIREIYPTRIDIDGKKTDESGRHDRLTICDVLDGNYIAIDLASKSGDEFNFIDCFHETFLQPGECRIYCEVFCRVVGARNGWWRAGGRSRCVSMQPPTTPSWKSKGRRIRWANGEADHHHQSETQEARPGQIAALPLLFHQDRSCAASVLLPALAMPSARLAA